jgi:hypothetical protein
MCWVALIPVAMAVVGGIQQGRQQEAAAGQAAQAGRTNAMLANQAADRALEQGRIDAGLQRLRTAQAVGAVRTAAAANGGVVGEGSNQLLAEDTAAAGELDALTIMNNAAREAYGYKVQAFQDNRNATNAVLSGQQAKQSSIMGGVLNGVGSAFGSGGFGSGSGAGTYGTGTQAAIAGSSRLNNNQALA